jgi:3-dehydroquinate dehydratase type I
MSLLAKSIRAGATYIDIEYEADEEYRKELIELARKFNCKVIISYHDHEETPDDDALNQIIERSRTMGADSVKLALTVNELSDFARVMALNSLYDNMTAFCMGRAGKITRVAAPVFGAEFIYVTLNKEHRTAAGQLSLIEMEIIYGILADE